MGNTAVSHRKNYDSVRDKRNGGDAKDERHPQNGLPQSGGGGIPKMLPPAKRARSKSMKTNSSANGSGGIASSNGANSNKFHVAKKANTWKKPEFYYPAMIPEPDYSDSEEENNKSSNQQRRNRSSSTTVIMSANGTTHASDDGLVVPKKLPNPCLESQERQNLHKELMFNKKMGKSVIGQKSELQKAMEKFRDEHKKKELEGEKLNKRSSFEKRLDEQASKIKSLEEEQKKSDPDQVVDQSEFLRVHARVRAHTLTVDTES